MRLAAIDIGSNSIHMVIAEATHGDAFTVLDREREVVQVGRASFKDRRLRPPCCYRLSPSRCDTSKRPPSTRSTSPAGRRAIARLMRSDV